MRKFYFSDGSERWPLQGEKGVYLTDPAGLGVSLSQTYADIQHGFFVGTNADNEPQTTISATLTFIRPAYAAYRQLVNWISAAADLSLVYCPTGTEEFSRKIDIHSISKGELDENAFLSCEFSLLARTPWRKAATVHFDVETQTVDMSMRYDQEYNDTLCYGDDNTSALTGTINPGGHIPAALAVTFYGTAVSPAITLVGQTTGTLYGACRIDGEITQGETLLLSTDYLDSYAKKLTAEGKDVDLLSKIDLADTPFFRMPLSEPCTLSIAADTIVSGAADVKVYYYYRSV